MPFGSSCSLDSCGFNAWEYDYLSHRLGGTQSSSIGRCQTYPLFPTLQYIPTALMRRCCRSDLFIFNPCRDQLDGRAQELGGLAVHIEVSEDGHNCYRLQLQLQ
jgi:hypothetical protein